MKGLNPFLLRLSRWPRRIAALLCLLLAAASALSARASPQRRPAHTAPAGYRLAAGQVAAPVTLASTRAAAFVHVGDRIGVLSTTDDRAGPSLIADRLRVLAAASGAAGLVDDAPVLLVAADRETAVRLAGIGAAPVLVVVDESP